MKKTASILVLLPILFLAGSAQAAKHKAPPVCANDGGRLAELTCGDPELAALDAEVTKAFNKIREIKERGPNSNELVKKLEEEQATWKKNINDECILMEPPPMSDVGARNNQISCIKYEYKNRLIILRRPDISPPLTEQKVNNMIRYLNDKNCGDIYEIGQLEDRTALRDFSCQYFEKYPQKAYELFGPCLGGGKDSFTPVCNPVDKVKQVAGLSEYITQLKHMEGDDTCQGAIKYTRDRTNMLDELLVLYNNYVNLDAVKAFNVFDERVVFDPEKAQLAHWARQGLWEKEQYAKLKELREQAQAGLEDYYVGTLKWSADVASSVAGYYTVYLANNYLGRTNAASITKYATRALDLGDLNNYLDGSNTIIVKNKSSLGYLLRLAVVNDYNLKAIQKLIADSAPIEGGYRKNMDTPLMQAVERNDVADVLLKNGANVNAQNEFGKTALMYAIQYNNKDVISLLLLHNADVNLMTFSSEQCGRSGLVLAAGGRTALMYAAWYGMPEVIQALISHGANVHYRDSEGETSYDYLAKNKNMTAEEMEQAQQLLGN